MKGRDWRVFKNLFRVKHVIKLRGWIELNWKEESFWPSADKFLDERFASLRDWQSDHCRSLELVYCARTCDVWRVVAVGGWFLAKVSDHVLLCWAVPRWLAVLSLKKNASEQFVSLKWPCRFWKANAIAGLLQDPVAKFTKSIKKYKKHPDGYQSIRKVYRNRAGAYANFNALKITNFAGSLNLSRPLLNDLTRKSSNTCLTSYKINRRPGATINQTNSILP
jgi:hypothetical protein